MRSQPWSARPSMLRRHTLRRQGRGLLELSLTDLETIIEWGQLVLPDPMYHDVPPEHDLWDRLNRILETNRDSMIVFMLLEMWWGGLG